MPATVLKRSEFGAGQSAIGYTAVHSHRSGENQLLRIEEELGPDAVYGVFKMKVLKK